MLDIVARLVLSPLLVAQALHVRRSAQNLPEAAGPRRGTSGMGPPLKLAIIGDSSAAGVGVAQQSRALSGQLVQILGAYFSVEWQLDAQSGSTTPSTISRLTQSTSRPLDVIVIGLGVNDVTRLTRTGKWITQQKTLIDRLRTLHNPKHIYISGLPPMGDFPLLPHPLRWILGRHARRLERHRRAWLATCPDCTLVPFDLPLRPDMMASDGFHPAAITYTLWAKEMASRILSDWPIHRET
ncbi:SGNH/GDSL hydrolase family protein [Sulfitobacter sp. F26204]|uniref:SGNH/GDSL hydrolase family protein n=1 Tax=Sulfitobacter sp. F26204 TaxID=2996014 RepID=UPI00225E6D88|nr:SGNH/GDSL hydrolase family protein [Sulfitobacter sp. F26204]MCX7558904.1 SGNH/GDSL hydrolase family protein [Sulfitobacter sp. F26204]